MGNCDIGLIGLAVMGQNLVLNMERNGFRVAVYNRTASKTTKFVEGPAAGKKVQGTYDLSEFVTALKRPRRIMIMVKAGLPVDMVIEGLAPYLEAGDLIIDGGNSYYLDTERRSLELEKKGIQFLGVGISGGEEGALWGPSIMPGGQREAYDRVSMIFTAIAARAKGEPCVTYIGPRGAGHYVKMVHNGIEYGDMQLIAEAYDLLRRGLGLDASQLHQVFSQWNQDVLASYLIEITADIFTHADPETGRPLVDVILDKAQQKGTGKWTSKDALDLGYPVPTLSSAVTARILSSLKDERMQVADILPGVDEQVQGLDHQAVIGFIGDALYAAKICAYAQGMGLLSAASREYQYDLQYAEIASIWRAGCIIRADFLDDVRNAYTSQPDLSNLLLAPSFQHGVEHRLPALRKVVQIAAGVGIPLPAMSASLAYYDGYRSARLPANLIQAQRDYFGAHTYERIDLPGTFHTEWQKNRD